MNTEPYLDVSLTFTTPIVGKSTLIISVKPHSSQVSALAIRTNPAKFFLMIAFDTDPPVPRGTSSTIHSILTEDP